MDDSLKKMEEDYLAARGTDEELNAEYAALDIPDEMREAIEEMVSGGENGEVVFGQLEANKFDRPYWRLQIAKAFLGKENDFGLV